MWPFGSSDDDSTERGATEADRERAERLLLDAIDDPAGMPDREARELVGMLESDDPHVRNYAANAVGSFAGTSVTPGIPREELAVEAVPQLRELCDDPYEDIRSWAVDALEALANHEADREGRPDAALEAKPELFGVVEDRTEAGETREDAAEALQQLADAFPAEFVDDIDRLASLLDDPNEQVRDTVSEMLADLAEQRPDAVVAVVESLGSALEDDSWVVQDEAARTLAHLADAYPEEVVPYAPGLVELVQDRGCWPARALERVAEVDPAAAEPAIEDLLTTLLRGSMDEDRVAAGRALVPLAEQYPGEFRGVTGRLTDRLEPSEDASTDLRVAVLRLLGAVRDPSVADEVREYTDDGDEAVAAAAREALSELDTGQQSVDFARAPDEVPGTPSLDLSYEDLEKGEHVGRGGNADVHRATVTVDGDARPVALKEPMLEGTLDEAVVDSVVAEAEQWAALDDHEGIVDIVDWGTSPLPWIAMEYMDGGNLATKLVGFNESVWIGVRVADAVHHAHRQGVVHLDLKPANVLFRETEPGTWDVPKVADWGLARSLIEHSKSVEGMTPQYAAPEQFNAEEYGEPDQRTDIYQLGAVLYELFTGSPPFEGTPTEVMQSVMSERPTPPSRANSNLPLAVDEIVETAMATHKHDRYETVVDLRRDLAELGDG